MRAVAVKERGTDLVGSGKLRVAIVNDLLLATEVLRRVIVSVPGYEVAWIAKDGAEAVRKCAQDLPDVVLMDLLMPVMDGVEATRRIMRSTPCAILIVTATVSGNAERVFEAMSRGALDAVGTPILAAGNVIRGGSELLEKIAQVAKLIQKPAAVEAARTACRSSLFLPQIPPLVAIGTSAGGPKTLATILGQLSADFAGAIVVVQHVDAEFVAGMVQWLDSQTALPVRQAREGSAPMAGTVFLAGGNLDLVMTPERRLTFATEPGNSPYRPSVDSFFLSIAKYWPRKAVAILLTGMGRDGAIGLLKLRQTGWHTIAQDAATSVVYGMPKAAAELNAATEILPLPQIAAAIKRFVKRDQECGG